MGDWLQWLSSSGLIVAAAAMFILGCVAAWALVARSHREQLLASARLGARAARFQQLAESSIEGIMIHDRGRVLDANPALCRLLGYPLERLLGRPATDFIAPASVSAAVQRLGRLTTEALEIDVIRADGSVIPVEIRSQASDTAFDPRAGIPIADPAAAQDPVGAPGDASPGALPPASSASDTCRIVTIRDVSERRQAQEQLRRLTHYDGLTGLPNLALFRELLEQALAKARRNQTQVAVISIDLDGFRQINEASGQASGDRALIEVAGRLQRLVGADDTVSRFSADEFTIIHPFAEGDSQDPKAADRLLLEVAGPIRLGDESFKLTASIGVAMFPGDATSSEELVRSAGRARRRAKLAGGNTLRYFESAMDARQQRRSMLERALRQAIADRELQVHFQPLVCCATLKVLGYESLARWQHPQLGPISPAEFIPIAEEAGLIQSLAELVLKLSCEAARGWPGDVRLAVNLSPSQLLLPMPAENLLMQLERLNFPADRLELEITEGVLMTDADRSLATLDRLRRAGVRIAMDDFGTGYSSLSYLQRFHFDKIKIDRSFIAGMTLNPDSMAIVRAVIALGRSLQITVIAEGVETAEQLQILRQERCDQVQGFFLGRPLPNDALPVSLTRALASAQP